MYLAIHVGAGPCTTMSWDSVWAHGGASNWVSPASLDDFDTAATDTAGHDPSRLIPNNN